MRDYFRLSNLKKEWNRKNFKLLLKCLIAAALIVVVCEILARRSVDNTIVFMVECFPAFVYNILLVYTVLVFATLFRRRSFSFFLAGGVWVAFAIVDCISLSYRSMPLTAADVWLMSSVRTIFDKYLSYVELGLLMVFISALIGAIFYIFYNARKHRPMFGFALVHFLLSAGLLTLATTTFVSAGVLLDTAKFTNLPDAYAGNGFCYCFAASFVTGGVSKPDDYSPDVVGEIVEELQELPETAENTPNIIFVQLESFFDPNYLKDLTYEDNPVPNFQAIRDRFPNGLLSVPCIGAGTANTEFEVLTGMNLAHFGVGEYPYMTIVDSTCPETIAYVLGELGYSTHAIHNNNATFYDRDLIYANLSFDTFTSIEYMDLDPETDFTPVNWAKDASLTDEILKCLDATEGRDFVFTVSVQPHGRYPSEYLKGYDYLLTEGWEEDSRKIGFEYYLWQLRETDAFVGALTQSLSNYDEDVIVVFYGDHLPSFNIQSEELRCGDEQTTEYVIWANFDIGSERRDLQTYQLAAYALDLCGIHDGSIFRLHQLYDYPDDDDEPFQSNLQLLEYDMLSGEKYILDGEQISATDLRFDVEDITIDNAECLTDEVSGTPVLRVTGQNFTRYSVIYINGDAYETRFVSRTQLETDDYAPSDGDTIVIAQISAADAMETLSQTESWTWVKPTAPTDE